jgi:hypothetical protein
MNARKFLNVRVIGFTATTLGLCGLLATSAMTTSCASSNSGGSGGGSAGSGGGGGSAGSGGTCTPGADSVCFSGGLAAGVLSGYGWIALGALDTATSPVCATDPSDLTKTQTITSAIPCPTTGSTVWDSSNPNALCISGSIPKVTTLAGATSPDYDQDWGLQIGLNSSAPPVDYNGAGTTLGKTYTHITFTTSGTITPANTSGIRAEIHTSTQGTSTSNYCATMTSGKAITLTSFNTKCYDSPADGVALTAADVPNIDKIGVQISSDTGADYAVSNFCLTGVTFDNN